MAILLAFAPFIVFAVVERFFGPAAGLIAAALVSAALLVRDWLGEGRTPKSLEAGTFCSWDAALYSVFGNPSWSVIGVRLCVDIGLLLIVLASIAVGRPFALQYARERVSPEFWASPQFLRTNYIVTGAWALAFVVMVLASNLPFSMSPACRRAWALSR